MSKCFTSNFVKLSNVEIKNAPNQIMANPCGLYLLLKASIIRGRSEKAGAFNFIYEQLYKNNILASRYSMEKLGKHYGVNRSTISRWVKILESSGYIKVVPYIIYDKKCYVYILGSVVKSKLNDKVDEVFLSEDLALSNLIQEKLGYISINDVFK